LNCDACSTKMENTLSSWHFLCPLCRLEKSTLEPKINELLSLNEVDRESALKPIREENFIQIVAWINELLPIPTKQTKPNLLEVGCAHGWFLECAAHHFNALGIEPDLEIAKISKKKGLNVISGSFPACLEGNEKFDAIVFNDVLEHIPDVESILLECHNALNPNGLLIINAPNNEGIFYSLSKILKRVGMSGYFDRMWQVGLPSPHLYYFNSLGIQKLADRSNFQVIMQKSISSVVAKGLFERINYTGGNVLKVYVTWIAVLLALPFIKIMKPDISVWILRK